jgi:ribosome-associated protein
LVDKRRGPKLGGGAGENTRPKIPSSHTSRPHNSRPHDHGDSPGHAPQGFPRPRRGPLNGRPHPRGPDPPGAPVRAGGPRGAPVRAGGPRVRKARTLPPAGPATSVASEEARALAILVASAAIEKKAISVEVLDVAGRVDYADFLVLMTGRSDRQVQAIAQGIEEALKKHGKRPQSVEGLPHASWVLMDYSDVVVHVFQDEARSAYDLEGLWMDASRIPVPLPEGGPVDR